MMRRALTAVACSAVLVAAGVPAASQATATAVRPSGEALVRVDGGTAYAKDLGKGKYRIVVPEGASITWLGEVSGQATQSGTFTPKALVAGWARLGHRDGAKALTTLVWGKGTSEVSTLAFLAKPRINADGQMTFVTRPAGQALPKQMVDFSINMMRASNGRVQRDWSTTFSPIQIDQTAFIQATAANNDSATVTWSEASGYTTGCRGPIALPGANGLTVNFGGFACGDLTVNGKTFPGGSISSNVKLVPSGGANGYVKATFGVTPPNGNAFTFDQNIAQWTGGGGSNPTPVPS